MELNGEEWNTINTLKPHRININSNKSMLFQYFVSAHTTKPLNEKVKDNLSLPKLFNTT